MEQAPVERADRLAHEARETRVRQVTFGTLLVVAGVILVLHQMDIFHVFSLWPLLLVGLGATRIIAGCCAHARKGGAWLLVIGTWFLLNQQHILRYRDSWPILLVAVGVLIVIDAVWPSDRCTLCAEAHHGR